jgi:uncharacterized protein
VVVCHSLACLLWLHHVAEREPQVERVLLVSPPSQSSGVREIASFFPLPPPAPPPGARLVCSDDDAYCPEGATALYGEPLGIPVDVLPGLGHLNPDAGYALWPSVEVWCLDGDGPITA